jgi:prevent-host-death family protein
MTAIGTYEARTHLSQLLERVANGETITITRRGVPVATLGPPAPPRGLSAEAVDEFLEFRRRYAGRGLAQNAIKAWRHEGHKY